MTAAVPGFESETGSVFETDGDAVAIDGAAIGALIAAARAAPRGRARLLLHSDRSDSLHEMVIALPGRSCDRPHINYKSGKSFVALSGRFAVICFSDDGKEANPVTVSADGSEASKARIVRLRAPTWHTIVPLAGDVVFLETILGPFDGNRYAPWFPEESAPEFSAAAERLREIARRHDAAQR